MQADPSAGIGVPSGIAAHGSGVQFDVKDSGAYSGGFRVGGLGVAGGLTQISGGGMTL